MKPTLEDAILLAVQAHRGQRIESAQPVTAPGIPKTYPDAKKLVREDCIEATDAKP